MTKALPQDFYFQDTVTVSRALLGKILCHKNEDGETLRASIVEVEAYLGVKDKACHTFGGRQTPRTRSMYLEGGHSYIYLIYGMYHCLNIVTRTSEHPEAVLIRALEPIPRPASLAKKNLKTNGPGKLCREWNITKKHDGLALWKKQSGLWVEDAPAIPAAAIVSRPRIGVDYAAEAALWPLRFYMKDNPFISKP